jgi:hypothetical protein
MPPCSYATDDLVHCRSGTDFHRLGCLHQFLDDFSIIFTHSSVVLSGNNLNMDSSLMLLLA